LPPPTTARRASANRADAGGGLPHLSHGDIKQGMESGRADETALDRPRALRFWRIDPCDHPEMVKKTRKRAFLAGAAFGATHADPCLLSH